MKSDSEIKRDVEAELRWTPGLEATDIAVAAKDGIVTLTGFVRKHGHKLQAVKAAKRVAGVVGVANDIEIREIRLPESAQRQPGLKYQPGLIGAARRSSGIQVSVMEKQAWRVSDPCTTAF
jgi:BON domain